MRGLFLFASVMVAALAGADAAGASPPADIVAPAADDVDISSAFNRESQLQNLKMVVTQIEQIDAEASRALRDAKALKETMLRTSPDADTKVNMDWKCFGICNGREQLLCAQFATIPIIGPAKVAFCVALIATKCALECK